MSRETNNVVRVWDIGVRLFHWTLVAAFAVSYLSREMHDLHTWSGYTVIALITFRLLWGLLGSRYARFDSFLYGPGEVIRYLRGILRGKPPHYLGHNPAGSWMIYLMLIILSLLCLSGLKALAEEGEGPFSGYRLELIASAYAHGGEKHNKNAVPEQATPAATPSENGPPTPAVSPIKPPINIEEKPSSSLWATRHADLANLMLLLIGIHILGVIVSSLLHRENLVRAMISGNKHSR